MKEAKKYFYRRKKVFQMFTRELIHLRSKTVKETRYLLILFYISHEIK